MNTVAYKCLNCGAELEFSPSKQAFTCKYCQSDFTEEALKAVYDQVEQEAQATADQSAETLRSEKDTDAFVNGTNLYTCSSCGAQIIADAETSATFCYYCHSPIVLAGRLTGEFCPAWVLPFSVDHETAVSAFKSWVKKKSFLPNSFKSESTLEKISGVYVPFWLTNTDAYSDISGIGKKVRTWTAGDYHYTETKEFTVHRAGYVPFRGVPADGSKKIEDALMDAIEPFPYAKMKPFSMKYLSGFMAQKYDDTYEEVTPRIEARIKKGSEDALERDIHGYTSVVIANRTTQLTNVQHDYVLLPVWFLNYKYHGKDYSFAINGQTQKIAGSLPVSGFKIGILAALLFLIFGFLITLCVGWCLAG